ncbi:MAG TPA: hypothetical protein VL400_27655 [Polyangiaceae bacterium]|nr:hypothetical protein [Polyangiaceae bacterium]
MVVLEPEPGVLLVALFFRGFWLEVRDTPTGPKARYLYAKKEVGALVMGRA